VHKIEPNNLENLDRQRASNFALTRLAYSPSEGAQVLGISRSKIYELIADDDLKVIKLGSRTLVPHSELVRFLASLAAARRRQRGARTTQQRRRCEPSTKTTRPPVVKKCNAGEALPSSNAMKSTPSTIKRKDQRCV
jgi:excisionase family DNA binding protein